MAQDFNPSDVRRSGSTAPELSFRARLARSKPVDVFPIPAWAVPSPAEQPCHEPFNVFRRYQLERDLRVTSLYRKARQTELASQLSIKALKPSTM
jgi:hypothetical protein